MKMGELQDGIDGGMLACAHCGRETLTPWVTWDLRLFLACMVCGRAGMVELDAQGKLKGSKLVTESSRSSKIHPQSYD